MKKVVVRTVVGAGIFAVAIGLSHMDPQDTSEASKIALGMKVAPVTLNLTGKDANLVGYGSYMVNVAGDCNGCHNPDPSKEYAAGGNPFLGQHPTKVNAATYLAGGQDFGAFPDPTGPFPHIISRNLTPDSSGLPAGGLSYDKFVQAIRNGMDLDAVHPTCTGAPNGKCIPAPFDGTLLQIMPWPTYQNLPDHELQAIYEYLRAVPCVEGGPGEPANRCGSTTAPKTTAVAGPKNLVVTARELRLDGSQSTSADGKALTYFWTIPSGKPSAAILGGTTATPTAQFPLYRGVYTFQLTVKDSAGNSSSDVVNVSYQGN